MANKRGNSLRGHELKSLRKRLANKKKSKVICRVRFSTIFTSIYWGPRSYEFAPRRSAGRTTDVPRARQYAAGGSTEIQFYDGPTQVPGPGPAIIINEAFRALRLPDYPSRRSRNGPEMHHEVYIVIMCHNALWGRSALMPVHSALARAI